MKISDYLTTSEKKLSEYQKYFVKLDLQMNKENFFVNFRKT